MLADFGAEVIKVEVPEGDPVRGMGKRIDGKSLYASSIFRNKRMISINLRTQEGRDLIRRLVSHCDILIENFRPGTMARWGLDYENLSVLNPKLVMVQISGFGQDGPYSQRGGYGVIGEAMSGMRHITGDPDRPPARVSVSLTDYITGLHGAYGAVLALMEAQRTGKGQVVDAALYESAFNFMEPYIPAYEKLGFIANRTGSKLPNSTPNNLYCCADGRYIHITAMSDPAWRRLCEAMGRLDLLEDEQFTTLLRRNERADVVDAEIGAWTGARSLEEVEEALHAAGVPCSRIYTMADIFEDPHYKARGMLIDVPDDALGSVKVAEVVPKLSETPGGVHQAGGQPGVHTRVVLKNLLALDDAAIDTLAAAGAVYCGPGDKTSA
jgi:crotonobetainyl-CoA:carnitine CoA-transferase CaiB-like acyl-CoA transferase